MDGSRLVLAQGGTTEWNWLGAATGVFVRVSVSASALCFVDFAVNARLLGLPDRCRSPKEYMDAAIQSQLDQVQVAITRRLPAALCMYM